MSKLIKADNSDLEELANSPDELLSKFAENMRVYDELVAQRSLLDNERDEVLQLLAGVESDRDHRTYGIKVAYDSLKYYIINQRLSELGEEIKTTKHELHGDQILYLGGLKHRKAKVESIDFQDDAISKFYRNEFGHLDYAGRQVCSKSGRVQNLSLDLSTGGFIHIRRGGAIFQAHPLIDRDQDYAPQFRITLLS